MAKEKPTFLCESCGEERALQRKWQRYCCVYCRLKAHRKREAAFAKIGRSAANDDPQEADVCN